MAQVECFLRESYEENFHPGIAHSIADCSEFKWILKDLIGRHILQIYRQKKEEHY